MQGNARGKYVSGCKLQAKCRGMQENARGTDGIQCKVPGESRGMTGESMGVGVKFKGNTWEWVYSARGMQGTNRGMQGSGIKC